MAAGKMAGARVVLVAALLCAAAAMAAAQQGSGVHARWTDYRTEETNWDLNANNVFCASRDADKPLAWRSKYEWTAFCGPNAGEATCGKCVNVTNTATRESVTVRVVDECGDPAFDLDHKAFKKIDSDGQGSKNGYLTVDYAFVDCDADNEPGASGVDATWTNYRTKETNWDLNANNVFCASQDGDKPLTWRSKYGWTAFCGPKGPVGKEACGKCINVTNAATGSTVTVRVVDECGDPAFDLDYETAFKKIDTDGNGSKNGHLTVDYVFVDCGDDDKTGDSIASM